MALLRYVFRSVSIWEGRTNGTDVSSLPVDLGTSQRACVKVRRVCQLKDIL